MSAAQVGSSETVLNCRKIKRDRLAFEPKEIMHTGGCVVDGRIVRKPRRKLDELLPRFLVKTRFAQLMNRSEISHMP